MLKKEKEPTESFYPRHGSTMMPSMLPSEHAAYVERKEYREEELKLAKPYYEKGAR